MSRWLACRFAAISVIGSVVVVPDWCTAVAQGVDVDSSVRLKILDAEMGAMMAVQKKPVKDRSSSVYETGRALIVDERGDVRIDSGQQDGCNISIANESDASMIIVQGTIANICNR